MLKRAIIFAGGKGKRLRPYTYVVPKPLLPIGEKPILEMIINQLQKNGIKHITISIFHNISLFKSIFSKKNFPKIKIDFLVEKKPLGTIGGLKLIKNLPNEFLALNGDLLTNLNFKEMYKFHKKQKSTLTLCSKKIQTNIEYGVLTDNKDGFLIDFIEKPKPEFKINLGIYIINKELIKKIAQNSNFGFDKLIKKINNKKIAVYNTKCKWFDIGREKDLYEAQDYFQKNKNFFI